MSRIPRRFFRSFVCAVVALSACAFASCQRTNDARADGVRSPGAPAASSASSSKTESPSGMKHGTVRFETPRGAWIIDVEIARTAEQHQRGLMFRRELQPDHGMIFVFEESAVQRFWMHNTLLRLDMLFLDEERSVVGIVANAEPQTDTGRQVDKPSRYVLEVSGGEAAAHAVGPGTRAQFVDIDE